MSVARVARCAIWFRVADPDRNDDRRDCPSPLFGDGTFGIGPNPTHTYLALDSYTVSLSVTFGGGLSDTETQVDAITVDPAPLTA